MTKDRLTRNNDQNENRLLILFLNLLWENTSKPRTLYSDKLIYKNKGKIKPFLDKD